MHLSHCTYCRIVKILCFWGPRPYAKWKRRVLFACSALLALGFGALLWFVDDHKHELSLSLVAVPLTLAGVLGLLVSVNGCSRCVARLFGDA
jgi:hypothetical protein